MAFVCLIPAVSFRAAKEKAIAVRMAAGRIHACHGRLEDRLAAGNYIPNATFFELACAVGEGSEGQISLTAEVKKKKKNTIVATEHSLKPG